MASIAEAAPTAARMSESRNETIAFVIMAIVLMIRPQGLFGQR